MANQACRRPRKTKPISAGTGRAGAAQAAGAADRSDRAKRTQCENRRTGLPAPRPELGSFGANSLPEGGASATMTLYDVTANPLTSRRGAAATGRMVAGMCLTRRSIRG